jgi:outer membrane protein assembly factor BamD (BamD/ComL family)
MNERQDRKAVRDAVILATVGIVLAQLGVVLCGLLSASRSAGTHPRWETALMVMVTLSIGGAFTGLVLLLRHYIRLMDSSSRIEKPERREEPTRTAILLPENEQRSQSTAKLDETLKEVVQLLQELRDLSILPEDERRKKAEELADKELDKVQARIRFYIAEGDFAKAEEAATQVAERRPQDARALELAEIVEVSRRQHEIGEVAGITQEVHDLISMSAWSQARQKVQELQERFPDNSDARQLMIRIEREYRTSQDEQQRRLYAEVQRFVSRKRWEEAKAAAHAFVERFAGSDDAEAVRLQIPTLELNAEIEVRQRLETEIMELAKHGRYIDATALAKRVIAQYPDSPQADALRQQISRLEELATNPAAPPARLRID